MINSSNAASISLFNSKMRKYPSSWICISKSKNHKTNSMHKRKPQTYISCVCVSRCSSHIVFVVMVFHFFFLFRFDCVATVLDCAIGRTPDHTKPLGHSHCFSDPNQSLWLAVWLDSNNDSIANQTIAKELQTKTNGLEIQWLKRLYHSDVATWLTR